MAEERHDQLSESIRAMDRSLADIRADIARAGTRKDADPDAQFAFIREALVAMAAKALERQIEKLEPALTAMGFSEREAKERIVGIFEDALDRVKRQQPPRFETQEL